MIRRAISPCLPAFFLSGLLAAAGCAVGPNYRPPTLPGKLAAQTMPPTAPKPAAAPWWRRADDPELARLVELALAGNRDLRSALARLEEARALRQDSRAAFLPTGNVTAGYRRQLDSTVFFKGMPRQTRDQTIFDLGVDSAWELDLFGRLRRAAEANTALTMAAEADLAQLRLIVAAETARACVERSAAHAMGTLRTEQLAAAQEILALLKAQVQEGKIGRDRLGRAETEVAALRNGVWELRLAERAAHNRLAVLTGEGVLDASKTDRLPEIPAPVVESDPVALLGNRPDVQAAERRLAAATAGIGIAQADYFPSLSLNARVGAEANTLTDLSGADANTFAFGPRLSWDILNLQRIRARVKGARTRSEQALAAWENTVLLSLEEIDNALARHNAAVARRESGLRAAAATWETRRIARAREREGLIDPVEVRQADQAALDARVELVRAEAELANARLFLQQSLAVE